MDPQFFNKLGNAYLVRATHTHDYIEPLQQPYEVDIVLTFWRKEPQRS